MLQTLYKRQFYSSFPKGPADMLQRLLQLPLIAIFMVLMNGVAFATPYEVKNVVISIQAEDAVKARDQAITKAQRVAFAALAGKNETELVAINDSQIARVVSGFSVQGERLASRSYRGNFTIRFMPAAANNLIISNGMQPTPQVASGQTISINKVVTNTVAPATAPAATTEPGVETTAPVVEEAKVQDSTIVVLPVLDIGSRRVVWDEPNPWRNIWQKTDHSVPGLAVGVPLGDVDDVTDIPDANFLSSGQANIQRMLERYTAGNLYIIVAKNQGAGLNTASGMALSLYRHDGQQLKFIRKNLIHPRPGYLFDDAVPVAMQMIVMAQNSNGTPSPVTTDPTVLESQTTTTTSTVETAPVVAAGSVTVTVPYQSLQQWLDIQKRLRMVPGVSSVLPVRVSSSSAQVRISTTVSGADFTRNLSMQNFSLQKMPGGELALIQNN